MAWPLAAGVSSELPEPHVPPGGPEVQSWQHGGTVAARRQDPDDAGGRGERGGRPSHGRRPLRDPVDAIQRRPDMGLGRSPRRHERQYVVAQFRDYSC